MMQHSQTLSTASCTSKKLIATSLGFAIFFWSALFAWQGLDFTDLGFSLAAYDQFYTAPKTNTYFFVNWLTIFIGHWAGESLGGTVVAYNLAASLTLALTGVVAYVGLRLAFRCDWIVAGFVFVTFLFSTKSNANWINYNNLTALFFTSGAAGLFYGLDRERPAWVFASGLVLGANLFIRLPNVLGITLVTAVILQGGLRQWPWDRSFRWCLIFVGGFLFGLIIVTFLILLHGHFHLFLLSIRVLFEKASDANSAHSSANLIRAFLKDHAYASVLAGLIIGSGTLALRLIVHRQAPMLSVGILLASISLAATFNAYDSWQWAVPGLLYFGLCYIAFKEWRARPHLALLAYISLTTMFLVPLGSANGLRNAVYGQWIGLPLLLTWLMQSTATSTPQPVIVAGARRMIATTLLISIASYSIASSWSSTYRDSANRFALTATIDHPLLTGTHTTTERAQVTEDLLVALTSWAQPGDLLLAYPDLPTVHFLTRTQSWLENPWPILYGDAEVRHRLDQKKAQLAPLPIVVRSMVSTTNRTWPLISPPREAHSAQQPASAAFDRFVQTEKYETVWSNNVFEILAPPGRYTPKEHVASPSTFSADMH